MGAEQYPNIARWAIPNAAVAATLQAVAPQRHPGVEAGVLWLGPRAQIAAVEAVVVPLGAGVEGSAGCWRVTPEVFGQIGAWSAGADLSLLAVCHTHGGRRPATLSQRDRTHSIKAPGVLAVVIGRNGGELRVDRWGWYVWHHDDYDFLTADDRTKVLDFTDGDVPVWRADARGVHPA